MDVPGQTTRGVPKFVHHWYRLLLITGNPAYLHHLIHDYLPARALRSTRQIVTYCTSVALALSAKTYSVSAPSVWNSLSYNCRSAELLSTFTRSLKTELFDIACSRLNTQPSLCHYAPLIRSLHMALYRCVLIDWLIDWYNWLITLPLHSSVTKRTTQ